MKNVKIAELPLQIREHLQEKLETEGHSGFDLLDEENLGDLGIPDLPDSVQERFVEIAQNMAGLYQALQKLQQQQGQSKSDKPLTPREKIEMRNHIEEAVERTRKRLLDRAPHFLPILAKVRIRVRPEISGIAYTNGTEIVFGRGFLRFPVVQQTKTDTGTSVWENGPAVFVVLHELLHVAWNHPWRGYRFHHRPGVKTHHGLLNFTMDAFINTVIMSWEPVASVIPTKELGITTRQDVLDLRDKWSTDLPPQEIPECLRDLECDQDLLQVTCFKLHDALLTLKRKNKQAQKEKREKQEQQEQQDSQGSQGDGEGDSEGEENPEDPENQENQENQENEDDCAGEGEGEGSGDPENQDLDSEEANEESDDKLDDLDRALDEALDEEDSQEKGDSSGSSDSGNSSDSQGESDTNSQSEAESEEEDQEIEQDLQEQHTNGDLADDVKDPEEKDFDQNDLRDRELQQALKDASTIPGSHPGNGVLQGIDLEMVRTPWKRLLGPYLTRILVPKMQLDPRKPARSMLAMKAAMPGRPAAFQPGMGGQGTGGRIAILVDTSGSVSDDLLRLFLRHMVTIARMCDSPTDLIAGDAQITYERQNIDLEMFLGKELEGKIGGRGGTSFEPLIDRAKEWKADVIVYLTDGYAYFPKNPVTPMVWVVPDNGLESRDFPYGKVLRIV